MTTITQEVDRVASKKEKISTAIDLPLSDECKRILAYADNEADNLKHRYIGAEHLLLGILREEKCLAAEVLSRRSLKLETLRDAFRNSVKQS